MKMTLLEMVQNILAAVGSDNVNSIADTQEAVDVTMIVKETFDELFAHTHLPERSGLIQLEGLGDTGKPNYLRIPENVLRFTWIRYRDLSDNQYRDVNYLTQEQFLDIMLSSGRDSTVDVADFSGVTMKVQNNKQPEYWTTFDDKYVVFDSWNQGVENTLHQENTASWGESQSAWVDEDTFIPEIDPELFPRLLAEAKSTAFINLKQTTSVKEEARSRRQLVKWQKYKHKNRTVPSTNYARTR